MKATGDHFLNKQKAKNNDGCWVFHTKEKCVRKSKALEDLYQILQDAQ